MNIDEFVNKYGGGSQSAPSSNNEKLNNLITKYSNGSTQNTAISSVPTTNQPSVANSSTAPVKSSESAQISNEYLAKKYNLPTNYSDSFDNGYNASNKIRKDLKAKGVTENDIEPLTEYYTKQVQNKYLKAAQDLAELRPGYATALSVPIQLLAGVRNTADTIADKISGRETNDYSKGAFAQNVVDTLRGTVTENIDSNVGKTAYGIGTSIGDMALNLALHTGPVGMGLEKASSTKNEAIERGLSDGQVIGEMVTSGLTTAITEAIPMGKIKKIADAGFGELGKVTLKSVIKKVGASMASEGVQEMSEDVADMIADRLIAKDQNQLALEVKSYKNQGLSDDEAKKKVFWDNVQQTVLDGVAGAISGGVMAGAGGGVYALNQRLNPTAQNVQTEQNTQEEITNENVNTSENQAGPAPTEPIINNLPVDNSQNIPYVQNTGEINNGREQTVDRRTDSGNLGPEQSGPVGASISGRNEKGRSYTTRDGRVFVLRDVVNDDVSRLMDAASIPNTNIYDKSNDPASFSKQLSDAKKANKKGHMVSDKTPEELKGARIFADKNNSIGVAVMPDGDIVGVHKNPNLNKTQRSVSDLILTARENGGTKLDCYGEELVRMYSELGFKPVARVEWNETFKPKDWGDNKPETVYVMMRDERSSNQVVTDLITGKNPVMESKDLDSLPMYSVKEFGDAAYDEALKYRDDLLAKQSGKQGAFLNAQNVPTLNNASIKLDFDNNAQQQIPRVNNQVMNEDTGLNESEELPTLEFTMSDVNRGRAIYENANRMKATQYATNTASQLARDNGIEAEFQQMVDNGEFGADVIHNADSKEEANRLKEKAMALKGNYNEEVEKLMSKDDFNSIDQDELQLIISEEMDKARKSGNFDTVRDFVKKATAKIHSIGEALQALAKYSGTASSAIIKTQTMIEGEIQNRVAPDSKRGKASSKLAKALAQMGDDTKAQNEAQPKTHEQVRSEVIETLKKEFSSIFSKFANNDIEYITRLVEDKGTSVNSLQDELEHYFKHGGFYTLDESIPVPSAKNSRLATILKNIGNKQSTQEKVEKNPGQIREEIINTLSDENASILNDLTDRELDFITDMIMDRRISDDIIADELEYRMKNGEFYTLDESVVEAKPRSFQIAKALDVAINGEQPKVEKPAKTLQQIKEEVRNTILDEASGISDNFTDSDIDFLANRIQRGTTQEELNDLIRQKLATGKWEISDADIEKVNALYDEINSGLLTSREVWQKTNQASKILASYLGDGTALEKMNQWRYFAMLSAPSTHLKNIISTSNFSLITMLKDAVAAQGEKIYKAKNQDFERTKSVLSLKDKGTIKSAWKDFVDWAYNDYASQGSHYNDKSVIKQNQQVTKSKGLNWLYNANSDLLSNEDIVMGRIKYAQALAGYLKANGKNSDIFTSRNVNDQELLNRAREYALQEAKVATFHEDNKAADLLTRISKSAEEGGGVEIFGKKIPLLNFAIEGFVPFKKTTMNVGKQFIKEYNPVTAIIRSIAGTHKENPTEIINDYAKSATGAGLMALGLWLGNAGLLVASKDDDDKSDVLNQDQEYALHYINKDGNEVTYTLDGLAPSANLLIVGALLAKEGITPQMLGEMGDMYIESSLLKGFENFFNSVTSSTYDKKKTKPVTIGANLADNYVSQFIPTLSGKLNRTIDATRRDTSHTGLEGNLDTFARLGKKYLNKLPGTSFLNQPYINKYGEEEKNVGKNALDRFLYNMFSIGYYSERKVDDIQTEIQRLQEIASDENTDETTRESINNELGKIFGSVETSYNGEKLNPLKYTEFEKSVGKEKAKNISALVNSDGYQKLSPLQQAEALNEMDNFSEAVAKNKTFDYNIANSNSYKKNYEIYQRDGIKGLTDYLATDAIIKEKVGDQTGNVPKLNALSSLDMTDKEKGKYLYDSMNLTKAAERAFDSKGYEGIYQAYILKQRIDPSGTVSQEEMINYLNSSNMSNSEKSYWFDIFFPTAKNKPIFE